MVVLRQYRELKQFLIKLKMKILQQVLEILNLKKGSLAYSLKVLNNYSDLNIWVSLKDYIVSTVFDDEFDEIYNLILGFDKLK